MVEGCVGASEEWENAACGLGKPDEFAQEAAEATGGEGAGCKGEPLEDDAGKVGGEGGDGAEGGIDTLANEGGGWLGLEFGFGADEKACGLQRGNGGCDRGGEVVW